MAIKNKEAGDSTTGISEIPVLQKGITFTNRNAAFIPGDI